MLSSATRVSRSFGSSGASVSFVIVSAFGAAFSAICAAQVRYEDGRTGSISADLKIRDANIFPPAAARKAA